MSVQLGLRIVGIALFGLVAGGCGDGAESSDGEPECRIVGDCAANASECRTAKACVDGMCVFENMPDGAPLPEQTDGDCAELVCDGDGEIKRVPLSHDLPDDGNLCTLDACDGATPTHTPQQSVPCYSGPTGTLGKGVCTGGVQQCDMEGNPVGSCQLEILPGEESCLSPLDEDCDGEANEEGEGCVCVPGEGSTCYTGPGETLGVGLCKEGEQVCEADGVSHGPCSGEILPSVEDCDDGGLDEDCDGEIDESGASCTCGDGKISNAEECDEGGGTALCDVDCTLTACGDGLVNPAAGEECDDGNTSNSDGCDGACKFEEVLAMAGGFSHSCALLSGGIVKCWGSNIHGQLGLGDTAQRGDEMGEMGAALPPVDLGSGAVATAIAAGDQHTCALLLGGVVKCWGNGFFGQLGLGDTQARGDEAGEMGDALPHVDLGPGLTATAVAASGLYTCALLSNGGVKCWGYNALGQLGQGHTGWVGDEPGEVAASPFVDLGSDANAVAIATSYDHACALLSSGGVKCWGGNASGQLGLGDTLNRGDEPGEMGDMLAAVQLGSGMTPVSITAGFEGSCAQLSNGAVKCWGLNNGGQLGLGDIQNRGDEPGEMGDALPPVDLGPGTAALSVVAGHDHTCALLSGGAVKCWGHNDHGHLGLGDDVGRGDEPGEMGDALPAVDLGPGAITNALHGGEYCMCSMLGPHMKCWGNNLAGQLGLGDVNDRGDTPGEMGVALPIVRLFNEDW